MQTLGPDTPRRGNAVSALLGRVILRVLRFRVTGQFPNEPRLIVAVAPHTSNTDWVLSIAVILALRLRASYLVKASLFRFPLGTVIRALGGIPVDRASPQDLVGQIAARFRAEPQLVLGITPEGTRSRGARWKRGFALIAQAADVPVQPVTLNYRTRLIRFEPLIRDVSEPDRVIAAVQRAAAAAWPDAG